MVYFLIEHDQFTKQNYLILIIIKLFYSEYFPIRDYNAHIIYYYIMHIIASTGYRMNEQYNFL